MRQHNDKIQVNWVKGVNGLQVKGSQLGTQ